MRSTVYAVCLALVFVFKAGAAFDETAARPPRLLVTPQRLHRLRLDRQRQTIRWLNFEKRVQTVPDSPERGFELGLYYAVTHDEKRGEEAIHWAETHPCDVRQVALVLDWAGGLASNEERHKLGTQLCPGYAPKTFAGLRNSLFMRIARGESDREATDAIGHLPSSGIPPDQELYALCEYLDAVRTTQHVDLRKEVPQFFSQMPAELLLHLTPEELEHPSWRMHVAALALVTLDPNLSGSQFLQGWAMEDQQIVHNGPGVGYELLWADPYLPGISYRNLDPWIYDPEGRLYARASWDADSCWIGISAAGVQQRNCRPGWEASTAHFGNLTLIPMTSRCIKISPVQISGASIVLWKLRPHAAISYSDQAVKRSVTEQADAAGMWRVNARTNGTVCAAN